MTAGTITRSASLEQLRAEYKTAFDDWAYAITSAQMVRRAGGTAESNVAAQRRVAQAYENYISARDMFASQLRFRADAKIIPLKTAISAGRR